MSGLNDFFKKEKKRIFQPDPFFSKRVVAKLQEHRMPDVGIWDVVPAFTRWVLALGLLLMAGLLTFQFMPLQDPQTGVIEALLEAEQTPTDTFLYTGADVPSGHEVFEHMIGLGEEQ